MNKYKLMFVLCVIAWAIFVIYIVTVPVVSGEYTEEPASHEDLVIQAIVAGADVNKPAQEPVTYEDWFRANANIIPLCTVTHYCNELYPHICGTGDGLTSTQVPVTPYWTCAVDPSVIPYGSDVMVDYGDRVEFWQAQDCGVAIKGNHIDLSVHTHEEAENLGFETATVYWMEVDREY